MDKIMLNTLKWMNISSGGRTMSNCVLHLKQELVGQQLFTSAIFEGFISFISKPTDLTLYFAEIVSISVLNDCFNLSNVVFIKNSTFAISIVDNCISLSPNHSVFINFIALITMNRKNFQESKRKHMSPCAYYYVYMSCRWIGVQWHSALLDVEVIDISFGVFLASNSA